jgi:hypothetical protein
MQKPKVGHRGTKENIYFLEPPLVTKTFQKLKGNGLEGVISLEEPIYNNEHFKIEGGYILYKVTNIFCL